MAKAAVTLAIVLLASGCGSSHHAAPPPATTVARPVAHRPPPARPLQLPAVLPSRVLDVPILMYHRIDIVRPTLPAITQRLTVDPHVFAAQMQWLVRNGFHTLTPLQLYDALEHGAPLPRRPVLITFDDGYRDVLWNAAPVIHRLHLHAVAFVITGRISGPDPSFLTWAELPRLERLGVVVGSHTVTHRELTQLDTAEVRTELRDSRAALERHLGHPVQWFAYPSGAVDAAVVPLVEQAGYVLAVTTEGGVRQSANEPFLLEREEILDTTGVAGFAALLGG